MVLPLSPASGVNHESATFQGLVRKTARGALTAAQINRDLLPRLNRQALLVSDSHAAYRAFARKHRIAHETVNLRAGVRTRRLGKLPIHVQNVNDYHQRFKTWLGSFRGVASRYLPNYMGWRWALDVSGLFCQNNCSRLLSASSTDNADCAFFADAPQRSVRQFIALRLHQGGQDSAKRAFVTIHASEISLMILLLITIAVNSVQPHGCRCYRRR
jgi:hypothetical protein